MSPLLYSIIGFVVWLLAERIQKRRDERRVIGRGDSGNASAEGLEALGVLAAYCTTAEAKEAWKTLSGYVLFPVAEVPPTDGKG